MAIEIAAKSKIEKAPSTNIFLYFCLILLIVFVVSYFVVDIYQKKLDKRLRVLDKALERTAEEQSLEKQLLDYQKKIKDVGVLLNYHLAPATFFDFLEKNTHPKVWFSKFSLDLEKSTIEIAGRADNFETLGQQIIILRKQELIKNIDLSKILTSREGKVEFRLQLTLDPKIFAPLETLPPEGQSGIDNLRQSLTGFK